MYAADPACPAGSLLPDRPCPTWNQRLYPSLDGRGNIVLMGYHRAIAGAIVDPETGCYAVLRKSTPDPTLRVARIYADSALVFTRDAERTTEGGVERTVMYTECEPGVAACDSAGEWGGV